MSVTVEEIKSKPFVSNGPAFYKEVQIRNMTRHDIVITNDEGEQSILPGNKDIVLENGYVVYECRFTCGMRTAPSIYGPSELEIPGVKITISARTYATAPYYIQGHGFSIALAEQAPIARDMILESRRRPHYLDLADDDEEADPRLVFQVIDPYHQFSSVYVNIFGQTIYLRAGILNEELPIWLDEIPPEKAPAGCHARLRCYVRYPNRYSVLHTDYEQVFEIPLDNIEEEVPYILPNGDIICVAMNEEAMKRVLLRKHELSRNGNRQVVTPANMISRSAHEAEIAKLKEEKDVLEDNLKMKMTSAATKYEATIQKLTKENLDLNTELEELRVKNREWSNVYKAAQEKKAAELESAKKEEELKKLRLANKQSLQQTAMDNKQKNIELGWTVAKVGLGVLATIITLAVTISKSKK